LKIKSVSKVLHACRKNEKKKVAFPRRTWQINPSQDWQGCAAARPADRQVSPTVVKFE
jgi:hypothetical protein